ncbi:hypothetical protein AB0K14_31940 [Actinosynnema sp. NPDC050801]|uniref:hypothetical protein n=1 Tax=unclassified Actinosynnema TaxID=2637065 RepID=UPI0033FBFDA9
MTDYAPPIPSPSPPPPPQSPPEPPSPSGSRGAVVLLSVLVVLLVGAAVSAIVLFVGAKDEHGLEVQRLDQAGRSLTEAQDRLAATDTANDDVANQISRLETQNAELRKCAVPAKDTIIAARDGDDAALGPAVSRASDNC